METGVSKFRLFNNLDSSFRLFMPFWLLLDMGFVYLGLCAYVHVCVCVCACTRCARACTSARLHERKRQHPAAPAIQNTPGGSER